VEHARPQDPQWAASLWVLLQVAPQRTVSPVQGAKQDPAVQLWPTAHT